MKHLTCGGKYQLQQLTSLVTFVFSSWRHWWRSCHEIGLQMYRLIYKFVRPNQNLGQKVPVRFGFITSMGSVRFEFYMCFSTWVLVQFGSSQNVGTSSVHSGSVWYPSLDYNHNHLSIIKRMLHIMGDEQRLQGITSQWDHTVLSATRQRWTPHLHPIWAGWYSIYRPVRMKGWVGLVGWLHTEMVYPSIHRRSPILILTRSCIAQLHWSRPSCYH